MVTTDFESTFDPEDRARAVVVDSSGRIVVVGETSAIMETRPDFALTRYLEDGTLDTAFGIGGKVITDFGSQEPFPKDLTLDAVGRIIVVGTTTNNYMGTNADFVVGRYLPDGSLDPSFGVGGKVTMDIGELSRQDWATAVTVDSMSRILVAGRHDCQTGYPNKYVLARYLDNGTLDPSFGTGGLVIADFGYAIVPGYVTAVMLDATGRIVVGGPILARFLPDGTPDLTFGTSGWSAVDLPAGRSGQITAATLDATDRILVAGEINNEIYGSRLDFALARYSRDGTLDPTFGVDGWAATDFLGGYGHDDYASAVVVDPRGRIVVSGYSYPASGSDFAVARYLDNGTLDPEFGLCGKVVTHFGSGSGNYDVAWDAALDAMGRVVVVGETVTGGTGPDFAVARYLNSGTRIMAFKQNTEGAGIKDWLMTLAGPEPNSGKTLDGGCITWAVTQPGAYTVTEEDRAGWTPQGATSADFAVVPDGGPYSHTFVNFKDVTITACKQTTEGASIKDWLMTLAGPDPKSGRTSENGCIAWTATKPGAYTVTEEDRAGWVPQGATSADFTVVSDGGPYNHTFVNSLPPVLWLPLIVR
jgi:uncharacterized delta-60 repeat protein